MLKRNPILRIEKIDGYSFRGKFTNQNPLLERRPEKEIRNHNRETKKDARHKLYIKIYSTRGHASVGRKPLVVKLPTAWTRTEAFFKKKVKSGFISIITEKL